MSMSGGFTESWVWKDTQFESLALIPIEDRGFRYGMSVFETVAMVGGRAVFLFEHLHRLELAAARWEFPIDPSALEGLSIFLKKFCWEEGLLRVHWTAGDGGPADAVSKGRLIVRYEKMSLPGSLGCESPLSVVRLKTDLSEQEGWKTGNYLKRCHLLTTARRCKVDEALLEDGSGLLAGAVMANVFLVVNSDQLVTPQLRPGYRNGTVREWVIKHHDVEERDIAFSEVLSAKEILLTNSRLGVETVTKLEGQRLEKGKISRRIGGSYKEFLLSHGRGS